ncbi:MAG: HlyD family secretion protein [Candidatus Eremiobacteraeota bacterium]|nr:HlyD family secretion protein [Candidatus Eremiobacteraeota bacterium]
MSESTVSKKTAGSLMAVVLVVGLGGAGYFLYQRNAPKFESTDNAQIEGDVVQISSEVAGRILRIHTSDNQAVKKGQLLVEIDPTDYRTRVVELEAALEVKQEKAREAQANLELVDRQAQAAVQEQTSAVEVAMRGVVESQAGTGASREQLAQAQAAQQSSRANFDRVVANRGVNQAELHKTRADLARYQALYDKDEVSRQQLDLVRTQQQQAAFRLAASQREVEQARAQWQESRSRAGQMGELIRQNLAQTETASSRVEEARSRLVSAQTAPQKVAVARAQQQVARAEVKQARASLLQAREDLRRTRVVAPQDGIVSRRTAQLGGYVNRSGVLMALVVSPKPWVIANFKETQMGQIRAGSVGEVTVDTYPDKVFPVRVDSVQAGTGARFSLLPPENASGSFVKVVQRLPVKLVFTEAVPDSTPLMAGMNVEARVRLR